MAKTNLKAKVTPQVIMLEKQLAKALKDLKFKDDLIIGQEKSLQLLVNKLKDRDMKIMAEKQFVKYLADRLVRVEYAKGRMVDVLHRR